MTERDAKLDARYRELAIEEPSIVIDDAIRAAARRAVATRRGSFEKRWAMPVSIAAVLVLAVGVTLRMQLEQPGVAVPSLENAAPSAVLAERAQAPATPTVADPSAAALAARATPAKPIVTNVDTFAKTTVMPEPKAQAESKAKLEGQDFMRQKKDEARRDAPVAAQMAPPPRPAPEPKREAVPFPAQATPPASSTMHTEPPPPAPVLAPAPAAPAAALRKEEAAGALASQSAPKARDVEPIVTGEKAAADNVDANVATGRVGFAANAPAPAAMAPAPAAKAIAGVGSRAAPLERERAITAEKELERIAELRRVGRHTEADDLLARFRREHPDYRIAEDIWEKVRPQ